jgi:hypothetical protein
MVPLIGSNGQLCQFGCLKMLEPCFPYWLCISKVLDLADTRDCNIIGGYFYKMDQFFKTCSSHYRSFLIENNVKDENFEQSKINMNLYYAKPITTFYSMYEGDLERSLKHYFQVMKTIYDCPDLRSYVIAPICVRMEDSPRNSNEYNLSKCFILFHNYSDYHIGFPETRELQQAYFEQLQMIVTKLHQIGVVHMDLYPSNIMWKVTDDENMIHVKLLDFDAAVFTYEQLTNATTERLTWNNSYRNTLVNKFRRDSNCLKNLTEHYDLSLLEVIKENLSEMKLQVRDKELLDKEFQHICNSYSLMSLSSDINTLSLQNIQLDT